MEWQAVTCRHYFRRTWNQMSSPPLSGVSAHLMRVTETAHWLEWQHWAYPILAQPFELNHGCLVVPSLVGAGIEWDEKAVTHYQFDAGAGQSSSSNSRMRYRSCVECPVMARNGHTHHAR